MERTEEQKLLAAPLRLVFGGQTLEVRPLVIAKSRLWRQEFEQLLASQAASVRQGDRPEDWMRAVLQEVPDAVLGLVARYLELAEAGVDRSWLEDHATDAEVFEALVQIVRATFPFVARSAELLKPA